MKRLYNPNTAEVIHAETARGRLIVLAISIVVACALVVPLHIEYPFLSYWLGACSTADYAYQCAPRTIHGIIAASVAFAMLGTLTLVLFRRRRLAPTITCLRCGTSGYVLDIVPTHGRCPRCSGDRYDYRIWFAGGDGMGPRLERVREHDVAGADLVRRFHETRRSALRQYY